MNYIIANWKMNIPNTELDLYCNRIEKFITKDLCIIISPPIPLISEISRLYKIPVASQNITETSHDYGAFTGEYSSYILKKAGADYSILGHSERRKNNNETNEMVRAKISKSLEFSIVPIVCIGEDEEERKNDLWREKLKKQIFESIPNTDKEIIIAYEPVWSIGTGLIPSDDEIEQTISYIHKEISNIAKNVKIVYGGSVSMKNASKITKISGISGLLVGGASLKLEEFIKIIESYA